MPAAASSRLDLLSEQDVVRARQAVRKLAQDSGFSLVEQTKLVTASSELARNTLIHGGGGYMLLRQLRDAGLDGEHLPALALTAFARPEDRTRALSSGFQMHLGKPIDLESLLLALVALARRRAA